MDKKWKRLLIGAVILVVTAAICAGVALLGGYEADEDALMALTGTEWVTVEQSEGQVAFIPKEVEAGFILYPEDRVDYQAYAPMLQELAHFNILCVVVQKPRNDQADGIRARFPQVEDWYLGGHGAGASDAAAHAADRAGQFRGLVLLGGYTKVDLKDSGLKVLTVYGDKDGIMDMRAYEKGLERLPEGYIEDALEGGNHAYFASCGDMAGDGEAFISAYVQSKATAQAIYDMIRK